MRGKQENETINKAEQASGRQNPERETVTAVTLTAAGTCEGAKAAAEVAQRAATASFMVELFLG